MPFTKKLALTLAVLLLLPAAARAQAVSGASISGTVKDASGAVLPGVSVEATGPALIEKVRAVTTDASGQYKIENLRPGMYSVTFTLAGFTGVRREAIELSGTFVATNVPDSSMASRRTPVKPASVNVTEYMPGRRFSILYWPLASVVTARTFSMSAGPVASTDTPGSTAPDASFTVPEIDAPETAWARAAAGSNSNTASVSASFFVKGIRCLLGWRVHPRCTECQILDGCRNASQGENHPHFAQN